MIPNPLEELRRRAQGLVAPGGELGFLGTPAALQNPNLKPWELQSALQADVMGILGHTVKDLPLRGVKTVVGNVNAAEGVGGEERYRQMWEQRNDPMSEVIADLVLDPWTYSGFGAFGKVGKLAEAIPNPAVRAGTTKALQFLDEADTGLATLSAQAMNAAIKSPIVASKLVGKIPGIEHIPVLGDVGKAFDSSQQTVLAQRVRDLFDGIAHLKAGGQEVKELAKDLKEARRVAAGGERHPGAPALTRAPGPVEVPPGAALPEGDPEMMKAVADALAAAAPPSTVADLSRLWGAVRTEIRGLETPEARGAATLLQHQGSKLQEDAYQRAFAVQEEVRTTLGTNALSKTTARTQDELMGLGRIDDAFARARDESLDVIDAVRYTVKEVGDRFPRDPTTPVDPARLAPIDRAMTAMQRAVTAYGPRIREAGAFEERAALVAERNQAMQRAVTTLEQELGPLPDELVGLLSDRTRQLTNIGMGRDGILATAPSRFEGDQEMLSRILTKVEELAEGRRTGKNALAPDADLFEIVLNEVSEDLAKELGLRNSPDLLNRIFGEQGGQVVAGAARHAGGLASGLWREFATSGPGYSVNNLVGGLVAGLPEGINPYRVVKALPRNIGRAARGELVRGEELESLEQVTGTITPKGLSTEFSGLAESMAASELTRRGAERASAVIGSKVLGGGGAALGGIAGNIKASVEDATPEERAQLVAKGVLAGGGAGLAFPKISKGFFLLNTAIEASLREGAYVHRMTEKVQEHLPTLLDEVNRVMAEPRPVVRPGPGGKGRTLTQEAVPEAAQQQIMADLQEVLGRQGNLISADAVRGVLLKNGVDLTRAGEVAKLWTDQLDDASQQGLKLAQKVHFDYQDLNNLEQMVRGVMPFSTWGMKALPYYARHLAARPGLALGIAHLNEASDDYKKEHGLTDRFSGGLPLGAGDMVFSALMGRNVTPYFNLLRAVTPFGDISRSVAMSDNQDEGVLSKPLNALESVLPGFNPLIMTGLRGVGLLGNAPARGLIGRTGPLEALTGIDLNLPQTALESTARRVFSGGAQEPTDLKTVMIDKRIDELAVAAGSTTRDKTVQAAPYQDAKVTRKGPIYEQAKREVEREGAVRSITGGLLGGLAPQAILPEEEARIREARRPVEDGGTYARLDPTAAGQIRHAIKAGAAKSAADPEVVAATQRMIEGLYGGQVPGPLQRQLDVGTNERLADITATLYRIQQRQEPLIGAYGPTGRGQEAEIKNQLSLYYNPAALLGKVERYAKLPREEQARLAAQVQAYQAATPERQARLRGDNPGLARALTELRAQQDLLRSTNPALDAYLRFETASKGDGTLEEFLDIY